MQLLHAANELPAAKREVVRDVGNSAQKQRTSQVQRPEGERQGRRRGVNEGMRKEQRIIPQWGGARGMKEKHEKREREAKRLKRGGD